MVVLSIKKVPEEDDSNGDIVGLVEDENLALVDLNLMEVSMEERILYPFNLRNQKEEVIIGSNPTGIMGRKAGTRVSSRNSTYFWVFLRSIWR